MDRAGKRFVYICSATPNQIINVMPLLQLGLPQVAHVLMLVGVHAPPTERDRQMALRHIESFNRVLDEIARRQGIRGCPQTDRIESPPDDTQGWQEKVARKLARIGVGDKEPLLNVTGGTRSMMFGAMAGIRDAQNGAQQRSPSWHAVVYLADPPRTEQLFPRVDKAPSYLLDMSPLTLSEHLSLRNYGERDVPARQCREATARCRREFTLDLVQQVSNAPQWKRNLRAMVLHRIVNVAEMAAMAAGMEDDQTRTVSIAEFMGPGSSGVGRNPHNSGEFWSKIFQDTPSVPGLYSTEAGSISFNGKAATGYFTGGWFEEYLFHRCEEILDKRLNDDVRIHLGVSYGSIAGAGVGNAGEIDIVIQVKNDLHLIECKAARVAGRKNPDGVNRPAIHTIATRRRQIAGPTGSGRLVSFQTGGWDFLQGLKNEAEQSDVTFWYGGHGLEMFANWLRGLARS